MKIGYYLVLSLICLFSTVGVEAKPKASAEAREKEKPTLFSREYRSKGDTLRYRILYPEGYNKEDKKTKYPLVVFLHAEGENGSDNQSQLKYGSSLFLNSEMRHFYPAVVLFPQCPAYDQWALYETDEATGKYSVSAEPEQTASSEVLARMIDHYSKKSFIDKDRIYLIGISAGGMGVLDLAARDPKAYAAVVSIGGAVNADRMKPLKKLPIRLYHGTADEVVDVTYSRDAYYELKANGSKVAEIVEYSDKGHACWREAMSSNDFLKWIFAQKK